MVNFITIRNKIINTFIVFNSLTDARKYAYLNFKIKKDLKIIKWIICPMELN
jgi:hypothetical protein